MFNWTSLRIHLSTVVSSILCFFSCKKREILPIAMECESPPRKLARRTSSSCLSEASVTEPVQRNSSRSEPILMHLPKIYARKSLEVSFFCSRCRKRIGEDQTLFCYSDSQYCGETCRTRDMFVAQARMILK